MVGVGGHGGDAWQVGRIAAGHDHPLLANGCSVCDSESFEAVKSWSSRPWPGSRGWGHFLFPAIFRGGRVLMTQTSHAVPAWSMWTCDKPPPTETPMTATSPLPSLSCLRTPSRSATAARGWRS